MNTKTPSITASSSFVDIMEKNHMEIPWHDYTNNDSDVLICKAGLIEKASVIGRVGQRYRYGRASGQSSG